jgi:sec-independent protein translocase protein TatB
MHVADTIFIFCLALIIFGPKKLPEIGRQIGKLMVEFRRASNEFKMQIEEELRASEEADRQKEITAAAAASAAATTVATPATTDPATATPAIDATAGETAAATTPVIAPPSTGEQVSRTAFFDDPREAGGCSYAAKAPEEAAATPAEPEAFPETTNGFNAGLNTASNGAIAEMSADDAIPEGGIVVPVETSEVPSKPTPAPVHHG